MSCVITEEQYNTVQRNIFKFSNNFGHVKYRDLFALVGITGQLDIEVCYGLAAQLLNISYNDIKSRTILDPNGIAVILGVVLKSATHPHLYPMHPLPQQDPTHRNYVGNQPELGHSSHNKYGVSPRYVLSQTAMPPPLYPQDQTTVTPPRYPQAQTVAPPPPRYSHTETTVIPPRYLVPYNAERANASSGRYRRNVPHHAPSNGYPQNARYGAQSAWITPAMVPVQEFHQHVDTPAAVEEPAAPPRPQWEITGVFDSVQDTPDPPVHETDAFGYQYRPDIPDDADARIDHDIDLDDQQLAMVMAPITDEDYD